MKRQWNSAMDGKFLKFILEIWCRVLYDETTYATVWVLAELN